MKMYDNSVKDFKWSDERLIAQIAHTIGHELFIHAYRKAIPAMKAFAHKDFEAFDKIIQRDTGNKGNYDHLMYLRKYKDEGLNLMYSFQKSLKNIIGSKVYNEVIKHHDSKYGEIIYNKIPNESIKHTEY